MTPEAEHEFVEWASAAMLALQRVAVLSCRDPHRAQDLVSSTLEKMYLNWGRGMWSS